MADTGGIQVHGKTQEKQEYNIILLPPEIKHP